ncbi:MAG TPA: hypothetical protein VK154_10890, partial [Chitinophagales bacterium]|nr:hypothetical protein [Chitinophagales bacterium]
MNYNEKNNKEENSFNKLNEPQEHETTNNQTATGGSEEETADHATHTHIPRKAKKKMKKEAALAEQNEGA